MTKGASEYVHLPAAFVIREKEYYLFFFYTGSDTKISFLFCRFCRYPDKKDYGYQITSGDDLFHNLSRNKNYYILLQLLLQYHILQAAYLLYKTHPLSENTNRYLHKLFCPGSHNKWPTPGLLTILVVYFLQKKKTTCSARILFIHRFLCSIFFYPY